MQQDPDQQRNLLLAVVLSMAVLLGWQLFYAGPKLRDEQARLKAQQELTQQPGSDKEAPKPAAPAPRPREFRLPPALRARVRSRPRRAYPSTRLP